MSFALFRSSTTLLGALALGALAIGCTDEQPGEMQDCNGAKCDDPGGTPTAHSTAVLTCDRQRDEGLIGAAGAEAESIKVQSKFHECLLAADNAVASTIEQNLVQVGAPLRSLEEIFIVFDEFRYASLCVDLESASAEEGDALALQNANCESSRERTLAEVIGALLDFDGDNAGWQLQEERESFSECYRDFDEKVAESEDPSVEYVARQGLVACAANSLRAQALPLKEARCELEGCPDELIVLSFVQAGFETAIATSDRACRMLIDASVFQRERAPGQFLDCQIAVYAELTAQVTEGLQ